MTQHSPAPWSIDEHGHIVDATGQTIADFDAAGVDQPTRDANKRLAIAAPRLLAALKVALNDFHHPGAFGHATGCNLVEYLADAIRQAEASPVAPAKTYAHRPESCPSKHYNDGTDICTDCGADLQAEG